MKCENCETEHTGEYGSGRFCSSKCARGFSTKIKRFEINQKVAEKLSGRELTSTHRQNIAFGRKHDATVINTRNCAFCDKEFKCKPSDTRQYCSNGCSVKYRSVLKENAMAHLAFNELPNEQKRSRIFNEQQGCCSVCGLAEWNGQPITLELDHISGNRKDESRDNLRLICPNCHSQTHTYKVKNVDSPGKRKYTDDEIAEVLLTEDSLYKVLTKLGMNPHGGNYTRLRRIIKERGIRQDLIF